MIYHNALENECELIQILGTSLGVVRSDKCRIGEKSLSIKAGDVFIFQTDGLMDTTDNEGVAFDYVKSQNKMIEEIKRDLSSQQIVDAIIKKADRHKGPDKSFDDDVTIALLKINT